MVKLRHNEAIGLACIAIVALILGALGRGDWFHQVMSIAVLLWIGIPVLGWLIVAAVTRHRGMAQLASGVLLLAVLQISVGLGFLHWDISASLRYCESLVPVLDAIYSESGRYPLALGDDARLNLPPPTLTDHSLVQYYSDGHTFAFEVSNPAEIFGGFIYSHTDRAWVEWRD